MGIFIASTDPATTEIAASVGFDFVTVDAEHAPLDRLEVLGHIRAAAASGVSPLVRVQENSETAIQSALDAGASGVVVPKVNDVDEAGRAVASALYAPEGKRGMCPACRDGGYMLDNFAERMHKRNGSVAVVPTIETEAGVENIKSIAAVDGVDLVCFGPGDLSAEMGIDLASEPERLQPAWAEVRDALHEAGKSVLVPVGPYAGGDALIAPMELILLHNALGTFISSHAEVTKK